MEALKIENYTFKPLNFAREAGLYDEILEVLKSEILYCNSDYKDDFIRHAIISSVVSHILNSKNLFFCRDDFLNIDNWVTYFKFINEQTLDLIRMLEFNYNYIVKEIESGSCEESE